MVGAHIHQVCKSAHALCMNRCTIFQSRGATSLNLSSGRNAKPAISLQVTKEEYSRIGGVKLGEHLGGLLRSQGKRPYVVPVGGSNALGTWGYLQTVQELLEQVGKNGFTDIVMVSQLTSQPPKHTLDSIRYASKGTVGLSRGWRNPEA